MSAPTKLPPGRTPQSPRRSTPPARGRPLSLDDFPGDSLSPEEYAKLKRIGRNQAYERMNHYREWADSLHTGIGLPAPPADHRHDMIPCHRHGGLFVMCADGKRRLQGGRLSIPKRLIKEMDTVREVAG